MGYTLAGAALVGRAGERLAGSCAHPLAAHRHARCGSLVLILAGLRMFDQRGRIPHFFGGPGNRLWLALRPLQRRLLPANTAGKRLALGMLWGWMPCGLSTTLLAAAWLSINAVHGAH